jgi:hypothetical protein
MQALLNQADARTQVINPASRGQDGAFTVEISDATSDPQWAERRGGIWGQVLTFAF